MLSLFEGQKIRRKKKEGEEKSHNLIYETKRGPRILCLILFIFYIFFTTTKTMAILKNKLHIISPQHKKDINL